MTRQAFRHRVRRLLPPAALVALPLACASCTANPATGQQSFTAFMSPQQELQVGRDEHPKILEAFGGEYADPAVRGYVQAVGGRVKIVAD